MKAIKRQLTECTAEDTITYVAGEVYKLAPGVTNIANWKVINNGDALENDHLEFSLVHRDWSCKFCNRLAQAQVDEFDDDEYQEVFRRTKRASRIFVGAAGSGGGQGGSRA